MKNIKELYNTHSRQRCFILGNGPSLNSVDFKKLQTEITFGVNSIYLMYQMNGFIPTYFVVEDNLVFKENIDEIDQYKGCVKILPKEYAEQLSLSRDDCYTFNLDQSFYNKNHKYFAKPRFATDAQKAIYCGQSVTYINLQIAYYLGFTTVILLGMDFSYSLPAEYKKNGNHIKSEADDPNHFHKDYFGKGKTWKDPRLGRVLRSYYMAKHKYESNGRTIFNATTGGELELFQRIDFGTLF